MKYFIFIDNNTCGPFDLHQVAQLYQQSLLTSDTQLMADDGANEWKSLRDCLPSLTKLETTSSFFKRLIPLSPSQQPTSIPTTGRSIYLQRIRKASSYGALRKYLGLYYFLSLLGLIITIVAFCHFYAPKLGIEFRASVIIGVIIGLLGLFLVSAAYQASLLFIDMSDTLIDIGRNSSDGGTESEVLSRRGLLGRPGSERVINLGCLIIILIVVALILLGIFIPK